mgnify:CR=1 FL=1
MYDLRTNMDISAGHCHCHSSLDLVLDATGDLSLISDQDELKQRFFLYLATPKGERYDPNVGCSCLDYLHEKNTRGNLRRLEQDLEADMKYQFPEIIIKTVTCSTSLTDPFQTEILVRTTQGESLEFLYTPEELMSITSELSNIIKYY